MKYKKINKKNIKKDFIFAGVSILIAALITWLSWLLVAILPKIEIYNNHSLKHEMTDVIHKTTYILPVNIFLLVVAMVLIIVMIVKAKKRKILLGIIGVSF